MLLSQDLEKKNDDRLVFQEYFPDIHLTDENRFIRLFSEIAHRTLDLVAKWQGEKRCLTKSISVSFEIEGHNLKSTLQDLASPTAF